MYQEELMTATKTVVASRRAELVRALQLRLFARPSGADVRVVQLGALARNLTADGGVGGGAAGTTATRMPTLPRPCHTPHRSLTRSSVRVMADGTRRQRYQCASPDGERHSFTGPRALP